MKLFTISFHFYFFFGLKAFRGLFRLRTSSEFTVSAVYGHLMPDKTYDNLFHMAGCDPHKTVAIEFDYTSSSGFSQRNSEAHPTVQLAFAYTTLEDVQTIEDTITDKEEIPEIHAYGMNSSNNNNNSSNNNLDYSENATGDYKNGTDMKVNNDDLLASSNKSNSSKTIQICVRRLRVYTLTLSSSTKLRNVYD